MTSDLNPPLAEAHSPNANRAVPAASARPQRLPHLRRLVLLVVDCMLAAVLGRARLGVSPVHARPDLPPGSAQALAASARGSFATAIAWMDRRFGILPGHPHWPEVSRAIVGFGGSLGARPAGAPICPQPWRETADSIPGMLRPPRAPLFGARSKPGAAPASPLSRLPDAGSPPFVADFIPLGLAHASRAAGMGAGFDPSRHWPAKRRLSTY